MCYAGGGTGRGGPPIFWGFFSNKILETIKTHKKFASAHPGYDIGIVLTMILTLYTTRGIYILYIITGLLMLTMLVFLL